MNPNARLIHIRILLAVSGLALLLLLSPCKVRNYIQAELGIAQTQVPGKSQTVLSQTSCYTVDVHKAVEQVTKPESQSPQALFSVPFSTLTVLASNSCLSLITGENPSGTNIPLYILYQNLKVYS
ncbi:MAG TPA: hypothetical protein VFF15_03610 [Flavobacteriaceae bacterium]|nr:hypothetical protein [Flavobacteriaceae bacterium]